MANMSYCRFENTLRNLQDCYYSLNDNEELSQSEQKAKKRLIELCKTIVDEFDKFDDKE